MHTVPVNRDAGVASGARLHRARLCSSAVALDALLLLGRLRVGLRVGRGGGLGGELGRAVVRVRLVRLVLPRDAAFTMRARSETESSTKTTSLRAARSARTSLLVSAFWMGARLRFASPLAAASSEISLVHADASCDVVAWCCFRHSTTRLALTSMTASARFSTLTACATHRWMPRTVNARVMLRRQNGACDHHHQLAHGDGAHRHGERRRGAKCSPAACARILVTG